MIVFPPEADLWIFGQKKKEVLLVQGQVQGHPSRKKSSLASPCIGSKISVAQKRPSWPTGYYFP